MGVMPNRRGLAATALQAQASRQAATRLHGQQDGPRAPLNPFTRGGSSRPASGPHRRQTDE
jgi:hypothetical protein